MTSDANDGERDAFWWVVKAIIVAVVVIAGSLVLMELVGAVATLGFVVGFLMLLGVLFGLPLLGWIGRRRDST